MAWVYLVCGGSGKVQAGLLADSRAAPIVEHQQHRRARKPDMNRCPDDQACICMSRGIADLVLMA